MQNLIKKIDKTAKEHDFSGVISIFRANETIYNAAFGHRDIKNALPNTTTTKFGIASGTKLFTALGIGKLIEQGTIALSTKISAVNPETLRFIDPDASILNLLTHTSGIFDYYDEETIQDFDDYSVAIPWSQLRRPSDYLPLFKVGTMKFAANQRFSYSNGGYVFLGVLIEELSGMHYSDFIEKEVLQAAEMHDSGFFAFNDLPANTAYGYLADGHTTNIYNLPIKGGGDGGMYTTTADLRAFWNNLFAYRILCKELTDVFLETHVTLNETQGYGCGLYKTPDGRVFSIEGSDAGVDFDSRYYGQQSVLVNILSNRSAGNRHVRKLILDNGI